MPGAAASAAGARVPVAERVPLLGGRRCAWLRELTGSAEEEVGGLGTSDAIRLLDGLLVDGPGASVRPGQAASLSTSRNARTASRSAIMRISRSNGSPERSRHRL